MPFENFTQRDAVRTRNIVEGLQKKFKKRLGETLVFLADEIYLQTGGDFPSEEHYEDFPQYENGIGIVRSLYTEIRELKHTIPKELNKQKQFTVVTGVSAHPIIKGIAEDLNRKIRLLNLDVLPITNQFFGTTVTVTGLICGVDLIEQLNNTYAREKDHRVILIPDIMLNEDRFLDDITLDIVREETGLDVYPFTTGFEGLLEALINY
jgi:NifB/MoaA-like Fe-S oxidoreductase